MNTSWSPPGRESRRITPTCSTNSGTGCWRSRGLSGNVYLSIDVDGFDPAVFPSTGTPQPGGLNWRQGMEVIRGGGGIVVPSARGGRGRTRRLAAPARLRPDGRAAGREGDRVAGEGKRGEGGRTK